MDKENNTRDIQLAELNIFKEFIRICNKLDLNYFLATGTLLGCIRHKGFIPWDDDLDVCMPREDYEIFIKKAPEILEKRFFLQNYTTEPQYTANFAKIRDSETTFIEKTSQKLDINHGIYIDIFPLDGYKPEKKLYNLKNRLVFFLHRAHIAKMHELPNPKRLKIKILRIYIFFSSIFYRNKSITDILKIEDKMAQKYKYNECKYVCSYSIVKDNHILKECFGKGKLMKFEDIEAKVPDDYDTYLKKLYGDYMKLPPIEQQIGHHYNEGVDVNMPYKEYIQNRNKIKKNDVKK